VGGVKVTVCRLCEKRWARGVGGGFYFRGGGGLEVGGEAWSLFIFVVLMEEVGGV